LNSSLCLHQSIVKPYQVIDLLEKIYHIIIKICKYFAVFLDYQGRAAKRAINLTISLILNVVLNLVFIPAYGALRAAMATSVIHLASVFLNWSEVRKRLF